MKPGEESCRRKRRTVEGMKCPLYPEEVRKFRDRLKPSSVFWLKTEDGVLEKFSVFEKYRNFVRLRAKGRKGSLDISMQYTQLMIAEREV